MSAKDKENNDLYLKNLGHRNDETTYLGKVSNFLKSEVGLNTKIDELLGESKTIPVSEDGRSSEDLESIIGRYINIIPDRNQEVELTEKKNFFSRKNSAKTSIADDKLLETDQYSEITEGSMSYRFHKIDKIEHLIYKQTNEEFETKSDQLRIGRLVPSVSRTIVGGDIRIRNNPMVRKLLGFLKLRYYKAYQNRRENRDKNNEHTYTETSHNTEVLTGQDFESFTFASQCKNSDCDKSVPSYVGQDSIASESKKTDAKRHERKRNSNKRNPLNRRALF